MRLKVLTGSTPAELEAVANAWLQEREEVPHVYLSASTSTVDEEGRIILLVWYDEERDPEELPF